MVYKKYRIVSNALEFLTRLWNAVTIQVQGRDTKTAGHTFDLETGVTRLRERLFCRRSCDPGALELSPPSACVDSCSRLLKSHLAKQQLPLGNRAETFLPALP